LTRRKIMKKIKINMFLKWENKFWEL
jgi:hypothetical protein